MEALYTSNGEEIWSSKLIVLPPASTEALEPGKSPWTGTIILANWGDILVKVTNPEIEVELIKDESCVRIALKSNESSKLPQWVNLEIYWVDNAQRPANIQLPFPSEGARLMDEMGRKNRNY